MLRKGSPQSSFPIYSVFFQEACALSLLETCIFHVDVAENLEDAGTDLLDYCVRSITHLIYPIDEEAKEFVPDDKEEILVREELLDQLKDMKEVLYIRISHFGTQLTADPDIKVNLNLSKELGSFGVCRSLLF